MIKLGKSKVDTKELWAFRVCMLEGLAGNRSWSYVEHLNVEHLKD